MAVRNHAHTCLHILNAKTMPGLSEYFGILLGSTTRSLIHGSKMWTGHEEIFDLIVSFRLFCTLQSRTNIAVSTG